MQPHGAPTWPPPVPLRISIDCCSVPLEVTTPPVIRQPLGPGVAVGDGVAVIVGVTVAVSVGVPVGVSVGVSVTVSVGLSLGVGVGDSVMQTPSAPEEE